MLSLDGAEHERHRAPFSRAFRLGPVHERFTELVEAECDRLLDRIAAWGAADLRTELSGPLSVAAMAAALGLDDLPADVPLAWYGAIVGAVTDITAGREPSPEGADAFAALGRALEPVLEREPAATLLGAAARGAGALDRGEVVSNAAVLLFGGIETTDGMIANALCHVLSSDLAPAELAERPALAANVVEESLRLEPAAAVVDRYATRDVELGGATIGRRELVRVSLSAANRDPSVFAEPHRFVPDRENARLQAAFAHGPHVCLGMHLARLEARVALVRAVERLPGLRLDPDGDGAPTGLVFRKPAELRVLWSTFGGGTVTGMTDALIIDAVRTPIGRRNGALAGVRAEELAAQVLNGLVSRHDLEPGEIEDVQMGCVSQVGEQALNVARMSALVAGWPETVCGTSIDRQCGSSMQAAFNASSAIQAGHLDVVVASGVESMSRVPMGSNLTVNGFEGFSPKLYEHWEVVPQGISAEVIADEWGLSREDLDEYSYESHRRAIAAIDEGRFEREIVPVETGAGGAAVLVAVDENPRRDTSLEKLASLKPAFKEDGKVTAGNSSAIVDGAAAMLVTSEAAAGRLELEPRGRFVSFGIAGVDPYRMLHGNPLACERALARAGLTWDDIAVIEVNEAFASVVLQFLKDTGLHERWQAGDVNPNGSGISLGHPLGATGARITATLLAELERREERYGVASMCIGQGQAIAAVVERL